MQRMMRAQYLAQFKGQPGIDNRWIQEQELQAANISDWPKAFIEGPSPLDQHQAEVAKEELRGVKLDNDFKEQQTKKTAKEAEKTFHEAGKLAFERGIMEGSGGMAGEGAGPAQPAVDPREQELAEREMGVKMRKMELDEIDINSKLEVARRQLAGEEEDQAVNRQQFEAIVGKLVDTQDIMQTIVQGQQQLASSQEQLAAIMLAPRVLIRDPVTGAPIAAKPDFSGQV
jgi:hypothetical protein